MDYEKKTAYYNYVLLIITIIPMTLIIIIINFIMSIKKEKQLIYY